MKQNEMSQFSRFVNDENEGTSSSNDEVSTSYKTGFIFVTDGVTK